MFVSLLKSILLRKGIRSDKICCNWLLFREPFRRIPFYMDVYALSKSQYWPREGIKKLQLERFAETVKRAAAIPFWKERFEKAGVDPNSFKESDIAKIPILTKKDFARHPIEAYTRQEMLSRSRLCRTSGSTGKPFMLYHDQQRELRESAVSEHNFRTVGQGERLPVILVRRSPHTGFDYAKCHFFFLESNTNLHYRVHELRKFASSFSKPVILYTLGSSLLELARVCKQYDIQLPLHAALSIGEELRAPQRKEIENTLNAQIQILYGTTEIGRLAFECAYHRLHLMESTVYFEITDERGVVLPPRMQGRIIVTGFENRVMPFIRYDTGDIGTIHEEPCPCGRTLRTLEFQGRQVKLLNVGDGRAVSLLDFSCIFDAYYSAISRFQIVRTGECSFTMRIVIGNQFNGEDTKRIITENLQSRIHPNVQIKWELVDFIPEGPSRKTVYFIDQFTKEHV